VAAHTVAVTALAMILLCTWGLEVMEMVAAAM
jgi:hypothetical protein